MVCTARAANLLNHIVSIHDTPVHCQHHVIDLGRIQSVAVANGFQRCGGKAHGGHFVQGTVFLAASARRELPRRAAG